MPVPRSTPARRLAPLTCAVLIGGLLLWLQVPDNGVLLSEERGRWVLLTLAFVVCETIQLHVGIRRQTVSLSFAEIPLVLGLFLVHPLLLLLARMVGGLTVELVRRTSLYKIAFNLSLFVVEVAVIQLLFGLVRQDTLISAPPVWLACYAAVLGASALTGVLVFAAVARLQGAVPRADLAVVMASLLGGALLTTTVAVLVVVVLDAEPAAMPVLLVLFVAVLLAYSAYDRLLRRHQTLELMHEFTATMTTAGGQESLTADALLHTRRLLVSDVAALVLLPGGAHGPRTVCQRGDAGHALPDSGGALVAQVLRTGRPVVVPRSCHDPELVAWLRQQQLRDAVVVPLRGSQGVAGAVLVGDRLGEMASYGPDELHLLQMIAAHLEIALRSGHLVDRLRLEATHDALTGLPNRTLFQERLEQALAAVDQAGAVLLLDLDGFKDVNDTLGHHIGDQMLREVARRLDATVPPDVTVARLGGDEFALLVPGRPAPTGGGVVTDGPAGHLAAQDRAQRLADDVLRALQRPFRAESVSLEVRASTGVALFPEHGTDGAVLLQRADVAMYAAKGDRVPLRLYAPALDQSSPRRLALIGELRAGIEAGQLNCYYQPKISLPDRTVVGVEALVRWEHPTLGLVPPDDFIPAAEHTGLIVPLTSAVLEIALQQCANWLADGQLVSVAVNVSPRGLLAADFVQEVAGRLASTGVPAALLTLEITESSVMLDPKRATDVLSRLHDLGVTLSVDDFGTGYSSLAYLQRLPVDEVKIDKSFLVNMVTDPGKAAIVRAIVDLGHTLGLRVVAEGVEDTRSLDLLAEHGCDVAQGYLVSRPLSPSDTTAWLAQPSSWGRPVRTRPRLVVAR